VSSKEFSASALPAGVLDVLAHNPLPALIVEVATETIVVASPPAEELFSPEGTELVGRKLESLFSDLPPSNLDLLVTGRLTGYETVRVVRTRDGSYVPFETWVRTLEEEVPPRHALFVFTTDVRPAQSLGAALSEEFNALIGTTDASLRIDRVRSNLDAISGGEPEGLVGRTIFEIIHPDDLAGLMWALAQSTATGKGVALHVHISRETEKAQLCQMLLLPTAPPPSFAFALVASERSEASSDTHVEMFLAEARATDVFGASRRLAGLSEAELPGLSELSSRELEVLTRLLAGHRVPAIAGALFISQSTVRNHLSSVFKKLGVESQQELIDLLLARMDTTSSDK
jgi:DNA-binding CsgD family transcriptional regulator